MPAITLLYIFIYFTSLGEQDEANMCIKFSRWSMLVGIKPFRMWVACSTTAIALEIKHVVLPCPLMQTAHRHSMKQMNNNAQLSHVNEPCKHGRIFKMVAQEVQGMMGICTTRRNSVEMWSQLGEENMMNVNCMYIIRPPTPINHPPDITRPPPVLFTPETVTPLLRWSAYTCIFKLIEWTCTRSIPTIRHLHQSTLYDSLYSRLLHQLDWAFIVLLLQQNDLTCLEISFGGNALTVAQLLLLLVSLKNSQAFFLPCLILCHVLSWIKYV